MLETSQCADLLCQGLPVSNLYRQRELLGWSAGTPLHTRGQEHVERASIVRPSCNEDVEICSLVALHLVLQGYLAEIESIAAYMWSGDAGIWLQPSYIYAEDTEPGCSLQAQVRSALAGGRRITVDALVSSTRLVNGLPLFSYSGGNEDVPTELIPVQLATVAHGGEIEAVVRLHPVAADVLDAKRFIAHYAETLRSLLIETSLTAGELRRGVREDCDQADAQLQDLCVRMMDLWTCVLGIGPETISERSSYFELGGTSLNAFKLVNRIRIEFDRDISIRDIMENPTVAELAKLIRKS